MGSERKQTGCRRSFRTLDYSIHFQFLVQADTSWQLKELSVFSSNFTHIFFQCPVYRWFMPHAYNESETNQTLKKKVSKLLDYHEMASSCLAYVRVLQLRFPSSRLFLLGPTPMPGWVNHDNPMAEVKILKALQDTFDIHCLQTESIHGVEYTIRSPKNITPIDRFVSIGKRRRDMIHPFFYTQFVPIYSSN